MKRVHTFGTVRHKRQADIILLSEYIKHSSFSFIALLIMSRLSEHE